MSRARAYVYSGEWVADCTRPDCGNVEFLFGLRSPAHPPGPANRREIRKPVFLCSYCQQMAEIDWPADSFMEAAMAVLAQRPIPATRNWYPKDHATAVAFHVEHGQSVDELRQENEAHGVGVS